MNKQEVKCYQYLEKLYKEKYEDFEIDKNLQEIYKKWRKIFYEHSTLDKQEKIIHDLTNSLHHQITGKRSSNTNIDWLEIQKSPKEIVKIIKELTNSINLVIKSRKELVNYRLAEEKEIHEITDNIMKSKSSLNKNHPKRQESDNALREYVTEHLKYLNSSKTTICSKNEQNIANEIVENIRNFEQSKENLNS